MAKNMKKEEKSKELRAKLQEIKHMLPFKYPALILKALPDVKSHQITKAFGNRPVRLDVLAKIAVVAADLAYQVHKTEQEGRGKVDAVINEISEH